MRSVRIATDQPQRVPETQPLALLFMKYWPATNKALLKLENLPHTTMQSPSPAKHYVSPTPIPEKNGRILKSRKKLARQGYTQNNRVRLIKGGKDYFDCMISTINAAKVSIHLQTYILDDDETGQQVAEALKKAAARKVKVYLLVDGFASRLLPRPFIESLQEAGIQFRFFEPLFKSRNFYFGRRLHHKILVVDASYALTGGLNIANRYNDLPECPAWLDFGIYIEGEAVKELCTVCWKTWYGFPSTLRMPSCEQPEKIDIPKEERSEVSVRRNDWVRRKNEISSTYVNMFRHANSHVIILCSYFLPGRMIRRHLAEASKRGIRITVITAGISDIWIAKYAERHIYDWLLRHKVELYEYKPNVLHGKIAVCDGQWLTAGSYNVNNLSAYASIELNVNVRDEKLAKKTEDILLGIANSDCISITREYHEKTVTPLARFARWLSYGFVHLGLYLSTFYYRHRA